MQEKYCSETVNTFAIIVVPLIFPGKKEIKNRMVQDSIGLDFCAARVLSRFIGR